MADDKQERREEPRERTQGGYDPAADGEISEGAYRVVSVPPAVFSDDEDDDDIPDGLKEEMLSETRPRKAE